MLKVTAPNYEAPHGPETLGGFMSNTGTQVHEIIKLAESSKPTAKQYLDALEASNNTAYTDIQDRANTEKTSVEEFINRELTAYYFDTSTAQNYQYLKVDTIYKEGSIISHPTTHDSDSVSDVLFGGFDFVGWGIKLPGDSMPPFVSKK